MELATEALTLYQKVWPRPAQSLSCVRNDHNWVQDFADMYQTFIIDQTNPTVMKWAFVGWDRMNIFIIGCYVAFVNIIGPVYMRNRKPYDLRWLIVPYNVALVLANAYICIEYAKARWFSGFPAISCATLNLDDNPGVYRLAEVSYWFYISKYVELADTVFFVLRKKERQLSRLHLIHHTVVPLIIWGMLRAEPGGANSFFPLVNSFVHVVMYTYYGISALGDEVKVHLWFKKYVTITQLIQFILVLYHMVSRPFYGCKPSYFSFLFNCSIAGFFFLLFCNFYWHEYLKRREDMELISGQTNNIHKNGSAKKIE